MTFPLDPPGGDLEEERGDGADASPFEQALERRAGQAEFETPIVAAIRAGAGPVQPVRYGPGDSFRFRCHRGVSCWNECCHDTDITLTPYDLIRLGRHFGRRPAEVAAAFGAPAMHEPSGMPVLHLAMTGDGASARPCVFLDPAQGCSVYRDRPAACRYYPLGLATVKMKGHESPEDFFFLVKEPHCKGHEEDREQTVARFRDEQEVEEYDRHNRGWIHVLMKLASWKSLGGPWGKEPDERARRMFAMASMDPDAFRRFVFGSSFLEKYAVDPAMHEQLREDDELLLQLAFDWLRNVLFNEPTIHLKDSVLQQAIANARTEAGAA
jgi:hypothetical protein